MSDEFKLKFVAVPAIDKVGTKTAEKDIVDFFKKIAGAESLKRLNNIFVNMPKQWNKSLASNKEVIDKLMTQNAKAGEFHRDMLSATMNEMAASSSKAWKNFSEMFKLGKIEEAAVLVKKLEEEIKGLNSEIKRTSQYTPSQISAKRDKRENLQKKQAETVLAFSQYVRDYNKSVLPDMRFSRSYNTFMEKKQNEDVINRKATSSVQLRENLNEYEAAQFKLENERKVARELYKEYYKDSLLEEKKLLEAERKAKRQEEAEKLKAQREIEYLRRKEASKQERLANINFKDQRNALVKSATVTAMPDYIKGKNAESYYSHKYTPAEVENNLIKTQEEIRRKKLNIIGLTSDTTKMPDKAELENQTKLLAELQQKEAILKRILSVKERENKEETKTQDLIKRNTASIRGKGFPSSVDFNEKRKFENRSLVENINARDFVGNEWVKAKERLEILKQSKNVSDEELETETKKFAVLDKELRLLNTVIDKKQRENEAPKVSANAMTEQQKLAIMKEQMRIRNEDLSINRKIRTLSGEELKNERDSLNLEKKRVDLEQKIATQYKKMMNAKSVSQYDNKVLQNLKTELSLTEKLSNKLDEKIQKGQEEGKITKTFAEHLKDAVNNAFTLDKILNRIAFVVTAKLAYDAFDFVKQSLADGVQNAIKLEAQLVRIASISQEYSQASVRGSLAESFKHGFSVEDSSKAFYESVSSQFTPEETSRLMNVSTRMAVSGFSTQEEALDALTTVLNAYKLSVNDAAKISDEFFQTIKLGKTTLSEIAPDIGKISATANLIGVSFEEVSAALATMTLNGIKTNVALTSMNQLMMNLTDPTKEAQDIFKEHGINLDMARIKTIGFAGAVKELSKLSDQEITQIASSRQGFRALATAIQSNTEWQSNLNKIMNSSGDTLRAYNLMMDTTDMKLKRIKGSFLESGIAIGDVLKVGVSLLTNVVEPLLIGLDKNVVALVSFMAALYGVERAMTLLSTSGKTLASVFTMLFKNPVFWALSLLAIYGKIKQEHLEIERVSRELSDRQISKIQEVIDKRKKELKLLETYKDLSEKEASRIKLQQNERQLLIDTQTALNEQYSIGADKLKDYNSAIRGNIAEQERRFEAIRRIRLSQQKPEAMKAIDILGNPLSNTVSYSQVISEFQLNGMKEMLFPSGKKNDIKKKFDAIDEYIVSISDGISSSSPEKSLSKIDSVMEKYNKLLTDLSDSMTVKNHDEITQKINGIKRGFDSKIKALLSLKEYLLTMTENFNIDTTPNELSSPNDKGRKSSAFNSPKWRMAKDKYENNSSLDIDSLLASKLSYFSEIENYAFEDENEPSRLKEEARGDVQDLVAKTNKRNIKKLESILNSADTVDEIIIANNNVISGWETYLSQMKKINSSQEEIEQVEAELAERQDKNKAISFVDKKYKELISIQENKNKVVTTVNYANLGLFNLENIYKEYVDALSRIGVSEDKKNEVISEMEAKLGKNKPAVAFLKEIFDDIKSGNQLTEEINYAMKTNSKLYNSYIDRNLKTSDELEFMLTQFSKEFAILKEMEKVIRDEVKRRKEIKDLIDSRVAEEKDAQASKFNLSGLFGIQKNEHLMKIQKADKLLKDGKMTKEEHSRYTETEEKALKKDRIADAYTRIQDAAKQTLEFYDGYLSRRLEQIESEKQAQLTAIDEQAKMQYRSSWWVEREKAKIEAKAEKDRRRVARQKKAIAYSEAVVNGAVAITNVWKLWAGSPIAWIFTALTAAMTGMQLATINAQKFEKGRQVPYGKINGKRHSQGGELIEVEGGEWIFSRKAVAGNEDFLDTLQTKMESGNIADSMVLRKSANVNKPTSNIVVKSDTKKLEEKLDNVTDSIKDMSIEVGLYGEFISDVKLAKRVQQGNKQRRVL